MELAKKLTVVAVAVMVVAMLSGCGMLGLCKISEKTAAVDAKDAELKALDVKFQDEVKKGVEMAANLNTAVTERDAAKNAVDSLTTEKVTLDQTNGELTAKISGLQSESEGYKERAEKAEGELATKDQAMKDAEAAANQKLEELRGNLTAAQDTASDAQSRLLVAEKDAKDQKERADGLQKRVDELQNRLKVYEKTPPKGK
jgi:chromosome segregation ATPase